MITPLAISRYFHLPWDNLRIHPIRIQEYPLPNEHGATRFSNSFMLLWLQKENNYGHRNDINHRSEVGC